MGDANLRLKLESGASRVFNCLQLTRNLSERRGLADTAAIPAADLFFGSRTLNNAIIIKETDLVVLSDRDPTTVVPPIRTKLFLPYDLDDPYEGGLSTFTDDTRFGEALEYLAGESTGDAADAVARDLQKIRLLEELPSLDPFLLKDKLALNGIAVGDDYLRLSAEEWDNIRAHIRERFVTMSRFATRSRGEVRPEMVDRLVDRIWEARELEPLHPLLRACGLPVERAGEFFQCWKGIAFYDYEFTRNGPKLRAFSNWLQTAQPRGFIHRSDAEVLEQDRVHVRGQIRIHLGQTLGVLKAFNDSFDTLFAKGEDARPFSRFMLDAQRHFWRIGGSLNAVYHALAMWSRVLERVPDRTLPPAGMVRLMRILRELL